MVGVFLFAGVVLARQMLQDLRKNMQRACREKNICGESVVEVFGKAECSSQSSDQAAHQEREKRERRTLDIVWS